MASSNLRMQMAAIDEIDAAALSYEAFCDQYMATNRPVLIRNVVDKWFSNACAWRSDGSTPNGTINFDYLRSQYGHLTVPVVDGDIAEYGAQEHVDMQFGEYLDLMESGRAGKRYLKDWHFVKATGQEPALYSTPEYFEDDWLNWWWDRKDQTNDYRFVYIGPTGSWTPMHHDVFRSYSWSVNIVGCKEWIFIHPDEEWKLKDRFGRGVVPDITNSDYDHELYPHAHEVTPMRVIQVTGDAIFVPSGWYHQVKNIEPTISINHNWFNGYNIDEIARFLQQELASVEKELDHLREIGLDGDEFRDQCQLVMKANTGVNFHEFAELLLAKAKDLQDTIVADTRDLWRTKTMRNHLGKVLAILSDFHVVLPPSREVDQAIADGRQLLHTYDS